MAIITWIGSATDYWSNAANWDTGAVPGPGDTALFDGSAVDECRIDTAVNVDKIETSLGFISQIKQEGTNAIVCNTFNQAGGAFIGSSDPDAHVTVNGSFTVQATISTFAAPRGILRITGDVSVASGVSFLHNDGTVVMKSTSTTSMSCSWGDHNVNNYWLSAKLADPATTAHYNHSTDVNILGNLYLGMEVPGDATNHKVQLRGTGELKLHGQKMYVGKDSDGNDSPTTSGIVRFVGSMDQNLESDSTDPDNPRWIPSIVIDKPSGTFTQVGVIRQYRTAYSKWEHIQGDTSAADGSLLVVYKFGATGLISGSMEFNGLNLDSDGSGGKIEIADNTESSPLVVRGDLYFDRLRTSNSYYFKVYGNLSTGSGSTATGAPAHVYVEMAGDADSTIDFRRSSYIRVTYTIHKDDADCVTTLLNDAQGSATLRGVDIVKGVLDANGYNIENYSGYDTTVRAEGTLKLEGTEVLDPANPILDVGSTVVFTAPSGTQAIKSGWSYHHLHFDGAATFELVEALDLAGDFRILSGTVDSKNYDINLEGVWESRGSFTAGTSKVTLDGTDQYIQGDTTFYDLEKIHTAGGAQETVWFEASSTTTITGLIKMHGDSTGLTWLHLYSTTPGFLWRIDIQGTHDFEYCDVWDSESIGDDLIDLRGTTNTADNDHNIGWLFLVEPAIDVVSTTDTTVTVEVHPQGAAKIYGLLLDADGAVIDSDEAVSAGAPPPYTQLNFTRTEPEPSSVLVWGVDDYYLLLFEPTANVIDAAATLVDFIGAYRIK